MGFPGGSEGKESDCRGGHLGSIPGSGRSLGEGIPTPVFLPEEFNEQRSLVGYNPCRKEAVKTEQLTLSLFKVRNRYSSIFLCLRGSGDGLEGNDV